MPGRVPVEEVLENRLLPLTQVQFSPHRAHIARICAAQESRSPVREKYITAGTRAFSLTFSITQRDTSWLSRCGVTGLAASGALVNVKGGQRSRSSTIPHDQVRALCGRSGCSGNESVRNFMRVVGRSGGWRNLPEWLLAAG